MANQKQLDRLLNEGVQAWNKWRLDDVRDHPRGEIILPDLSGADLTGADLQGAILAGADLVRTDLRRSKLQGANLVGTDLTGADLSGTHLVGALLTGADLSGATFTGADLINANFRDAILFDTDFSGAILSDTIFGNVDLSTAKGLEMADQRGPSTIGIDTILRSKGNIPETFLRGAGVPPSIIEAIPSLVGSLKPIDFYSCFISYSSKDQDFAERLYTDLLAKGVRCWLDKEDLKIGEKFRPRIDEAIRRHDKLLLVLSQNSVRSPWVEKEVETAFEKERRYKKLVLFPIRLDDAVMRARQAWAADIRRQRHIGDFTCWKDHDTYQKAFTRLLRDLKAEAQKT